MDLKGENKTAGESVIEEKGQPPVDGVQRRLDGGHLRIIPHKSGADEQVLLPGSVYGQTDQHSRAVRYRDILNLCQGKDVFLSQVLMHRLQGGPHNDTVAVAHAGQALGAALKGDLLVGQGYRGLGAVGG